MSKPRLLLIDDELPYCELMQSRLGADYEIVVAHSISEGLKAVKEQGPFDLVLLDLILPDSDRETTLPRYLAHFPAQPPIILSGFAEPNFINRMIRLGARGYLIKGQDDLDTATMRSRLRMLVMHGRTSAKLAEAQTELTRLGNELSRISSDL